METNRIPRYDDSDKLTGCCPRFDPQGWDGQDLHFSDKPFVRVTTCSLFHVPINMGRVFKRTFAAIEAASARPDSEFIVLSRDLSPWSSEHYFAVSHAVPGQDMRTLPGDYVTAVFEGPYQLAPKWEKEMAARAAARGKRPEAIYFFYTTCPRCAAAYGKNYIVGIAKLGT